MLDLTKSPQWPEVQLIVDRLRKAGFEALLAGGCVRDALLGRWPKDFDIATSARPDDVERLFEKVVAVGKAFGVMVVVVNEQPFEVATFRTDGAYADGRRPEKIDFSSAKKDALRRDFTVNALFYDPRRREIIDYVGGNRDLSRKILKTVGDPSQRFAEDHLRILRAVRFSGQLGFSIDQRTYAAMVRLRSTLRKVSRERITQELEKLLAGPFYETALETLISAKLLEEIFFRSETVELKLPGLPSPRESVSDPLEAWLRFFSRTGKDLKFFEELAAQLTLSKKVSRGLRYVLEHSGDLVDSTLRPGEKIKLIGQREYGMHLLKFTQDQVAENRELSRALEGLVHSYRKVMTTTGELPAPFLKGDDLIKFKVPPGRQMGLILDEAYSLQLEERLQTRSSALNWLKEACTSNEV